MMGGFASGLLAVTSMASSLVVLGCASNHQEAKWMELAKMVENLRLRVRQQEAQLEELRNVCLVISNRTAAESTAPLPSVKIPELEVVRLGPERTEPPHDAVAEPTRENQTPLLKGNGTQGARHFRKALAAFRAGDFLGARSGFERFAQIQPNHEEAASAQFWLGECSVELKQCGRAIGAFGSFVASFPTSRKVPDALLKIGLCHEQLGHFPAAREAFEDLVRRFPKSALADLARARLGRLSDQGGPR